MRYVVLGKPDCPYCDDAIVLLEKYALPYSYINVDTQTKQFLRALGLTTVPQVWQSTEYGICYIGGYDQLLNWLEPEPANDNQLELPLDEQD
jgi:glutaredoxin